MKALPWIIGAVLLGVGFFVLPRAKVLSATGKIFRVGARNLMEVTSSAPAGMVA